MTCTRRRLTTLICVGLTALTAIAPNAATAQTVVESVPAVTTSSSERTANAPVVPPMPTTNPANKQTEIMVRQPGDTLKTCDELWNEAMSMREEIARTRIRQNDNKMTDRGIGAAGAIAGMLIGTATGGIGIAAAGIAARAATQARTDEAEAIQEAAQQRRALMAGIFMIKDCPGPIENALSDIKVMSPEEKALAAMAPAGGAPIGPEETERTAGKQMIITGESGNPKGHTAGAYKPYHAPKKTIDKPLND